MSGDRSEAQVARSREIGVSVDAVEFLRCAAHPGRAARDRCPRCERPRCAADAARYGPGCGACAVDRPVRRVSTTETVMRSALAGLPVAYIGGWIASQYVEVHVFSWLVPVVIGLAASWAGTAAAAKGGRALPVGLPVAVVMALLGTALGFRLYPHGPHNPLTPWDEIGVPYLCTIGAALVWPLLWGTPKRGGGKVAERSEPVR